MYTRLDDRCDTQLLSTLQGCTEQIIDQLFHLLLLNYFLTGVSGEGVMTTFSSVLHARDNLNKKSQWLYSFLGAMAQNLQMSSQQSFVPNCSVQGDIAMLKD